MALSYFDRFLLGKELTKHLLQIVSVTCLFVACKIFESKPIKLVSSESDAYICLCTLHSIQIVLDRINELHPWKVRPQ